MAWQQIFEQTDRDINLQRVMNVMVYGEETARHDWIPDRAIGPTDDWLYELEREFNDWNWRVCSTRDPQKLPGMGTTEKRDAADGASQTGVIQADSGLLRERGWSERGFPD